MAWRDIPDTEIDPEKFLTSPTLQTLRDNPAAIANGDDGAPRIQPNAHPLAVAGNYVEAWSYTVSAPSYNVWGKHLEFRIPRRGTYRVRMWLNSIGNYQIQSRVYRNGSAIGSTLSPASNTDATLDQDLAGWEAGDLCQIYTFTNHSGQSGELAAYVMTGNGIVATPHVDYLPPHP